MKTPLLIALTLFIAIASPAHAADTFLKATVTGTVETQKLISATESRVHTEILNNKRIFLEFLVTPADYELVVDVSGNGELLLLPKHLGAMLPTLSVLQLGSNSQNILDTQAKIFRIAANIAPGVATNLFQNLDGEISGTLKFSGPVTSLVFKGFTFTVLGHGTNPAGSNDAALLKFKVAAAGVFTQAP